jgi:hypothetical protein
VVTPPESVVPATGVETDADGQRRPILPRRQQPAPPAPKGPATPAAPGTASPMPAQAHPHLAELRRIVAVSEKRWKQLDTYEAKLTRREAVNGEKPETQEVLFQFRREPMAVYTKNIGEIGRGREILYYPSKHGDMIHIVVGEGDTRLLRAGSRAPSMSPDSPQVKAKSRYGIREIGFGTTIARFAKLVAGVESGKLPADSVKFLGVVKRAEYGELPLIAVQQTLRPGDEPQMPKGGVRQWFFDAKPDSPSYALPILIIAFENAQPKAREVEYYCFTQFRSPANLTEADFDPARLGKK